MHRSVLLLFLVIWLTNSATAFSYPAMCYKSGKPTSNTSSYTISSGDSPAAIPAANMPSGAVVWQSSEVSVEVTCERFERSGNGKPTQVLTGLDGNYYGGVEGLIQGYRYQGINYIFDRNLNPTPYMLGPNVGDKVSFNFTFSVNTVRRSGGAVPTSGPVWQGSNFPALVVYVRSGGVDIYVNGFTIYVTNPGITLIDCGADVRISKNTIDFGEISAFRAANKEIAKQVPFEISSSRSCAGKFKVNATLKPLASNSYTRGDFLVPSQNDSIGIRIRNQGNGEIFPFDQKKELADLTSSTSQTNRYVAEAVWQTDKPKLGRPEAGATLQIEYQ
ncbi:fimbrial protein [Burkholderia ubonensis]|uniref:fimbrial protein n=1 Tax=Burkholderia ubonensis TaxID=101571 RepID=UPI0009B430DE|nr:fimbrial protein [Burkholderia ubonensis]